jgi:hypothetical protein
MDVSTFRWVAVCAGLVSVVGLLPLVSDVPIPTAIGATCFVVGLGGLVVLALLAVMRRASRPG